MRKEVYEELRNKYSNFDDAYTKLVNLNEIFFDASNSQIRQKGHVQTNVPKMAAAISQGVKMPPISVRELSNGKYELKDGATRFLATKVANRSKILVSNYFDKQNPTKEEWFDIQCIQNDHLIATPNSDADIQSQVSVRVNNGTLQNKVGFKYSDNPELFISKSTEYLSKKVYVNSGFSTLKWKSILKKCLAGTITTMFESYSKDTSMEFIKNYNTLGWSNEKVKLQLSIGDICNNVCFYPCANLSQLRVNAFANGGYKSIDNPNVKIYAVVYLGELAGKDEKKLIEYRKAMLAEYKKINNHFNIFAGLFFLPQIKTGQNKENLTALIKAV
jgi:hypothetical protein